MPLSVSETRALAGRLANILVAKKRAPQAIQILCGWAVSGPNDKEGQTLLGEALHLDSRGALAKMAFERMEGTAGDHGELDQAIARWVEPELIKLEKDLTKPAFRKAQLGFNNEMKYK